MFNPFKKRKVDAADAHPSLALSKTTAEEYAAGLAAELADVPDEESSAVSRSRKKATQIGRRGLRPIIVGGKKFGRRLVRRYRKSKLATWRDSKTAMKKYRRERYARLKRERAARKRSGPKSALKK